MFAKIHTHRIKYDRLPTQWAEGLPMGNGKWGVFCWSDGSRLRFTLDSASAWDVRHPGGRPDYGQLSYAELRKRVAQGDAEEIEAAAKRMGAKDPLRPTKVYLGRLELIYEFDPASALELHLAEACVRGTLGRGRARHALGAFVCQDRNLFCLRIDPWPKSAQLEFKPFYETSPGLAELRHPDVECFEKDGLSFAVQKILPNTFFAICWNREGPEIFLSFSQNSDWEDAVNEAFDGHPCQTRETFDFLSNAHAKAWKDFWSASAVALPERDIEFAWYYGLYLLGSCARQGSNPPGLQGLWPMEGRNPPWRGDYHTDMNVQETFWSAGSANHLELLDVWLDFAFDTLPEAERLTREIFGTEGAFQHCTLLPGYTVLTGAGWHTVAFAWSHTGWLAQLAWLRWRYSKDPEWLEQKGYPIVRSAFQFYAANLELEGDGKYHVPLSSSPEYNGPDMAAWCRDPNIDIALIRRCCDWVTEMEQALGREEFSDQAQEIHDLLVPYHLVPFDYPAPYVRGRAPKGPCVLALWKDHPLDYSHRHPSHLMAIHPAMDISIEGPEQDRAIIEASLLHYLALGQYCWAGHTYVQMASLAAHVGKPEMAYRFVRNFLDRWVLPNGLHFNREIGEQGSSHFWCTRQEQFGEAAPFTINETCGFTGTITDMLVQGWGDVLRIFPAVPARWRDLLFIDLRTEGAFTVSALRREGQTRWVEIHADIDSVCRLREPFGGTEFNTHGAVPTRESGLLVWPMAPGQTVTLFTPGHESPDFSGEAANIRTQRPLTISLESEG